LTILGRREFAAVVQLLCTPHPVAGPLARPAPPDGRRGAGWVRPPHRCRCVTRSAGSGWHG